MIDSAGSRTYYPQYFIITKHDRVLSCCLIQNSVLKQYLVQWTKDLTRTFSNKKGLHLGSPRVLGAQKRISCDGSFTLHFGEKLPASSHELFSGLSTLGNPEKSQQRAILQIFTHPDTNHAKRCLTSVIFWKHENWYIRRAIAARWLAEILTRYSVSSNMNSWILWVIKMKTVRFQADFQLSSR